jgi:hypothetical protein
LAVGDNRLCIGKRQLARGKIHKSDGCVPNGLFENEISADWHSILAKIRCGKWRRDEMTIPGMRSMTWSSLSDELDRWADAGSTATFWWRDDDAISDTRQLHSLLDCAGQTPVALAVIPGLVASSLAKRLERHPTVTVLQHGWRHANHAKEGNPSEYPAGRNREEVTGEFSEGMRQLSDLFRAQHLLVFAPPWHGLDQSYLPLLRQVGLRAISRARARTHAVISGLLVSNVHCVPILWSDPPSIGPDEIYLSQLIDHLEGRRQGRYDGDEPTGVLTHHLVQDARSYEFMAKLSAIVSGHSAACWLDARDIFHVSSN